MAPFVVARRGTWEVRWLGILRDSWRTPERKHLSFGSSVKGALVWGFGRIWVGGLRGRTSRSVGAPLGNLVGSLLPGLP